MLIDVLRNTLTLANLRPQYLNLLLSRADLYEQAFTSKTYDPINNYEMYEILGDGSANKFLVWYLYRRFPQLHCPDGVKVLTRLKINYVSKRSFSSIADKLGFWPYIRASDEQKAKAKKSLLEDVFEAFIGLTELVVDNYFAVGVGFVVVNDILTAIFDDMYISLKFEDLYDAITRVKELFDKHPQLGKTVYVTVNTVVPKGKATTITRVLPNGTKSILGEGRGLLKEDSEQNAAKQALIELEMMGIERKVTYDLFCAAPRV